MDFNDIVVRDCGGLRAGAPAVGLATNANAPDHAPKAGAGDMAKKRSAKKSIRKGKQAPRPAKPDRWHTLNQFVDQIGPHLSLATREVWYRLLRYSTNGVTETTMRRMAQSARMNKATVANAIKVLESVGLIRTIQQSDTHGKNSKYRIHPRPVDCLPKVLEQFPDLT
jgi:hypothetical protein